MAPGGIEIWFIAFIAVLLVGPLVLAGIFTLLARRASRNPRPPAGWFTDPSGSHQLRYWDGSGWTENVRDGEIASTHRFPRNAPAPGDAAPSESLGILAEQPAPPTSGFWTKRRTTIAVTLLGLALLVPCAVAGIGVWQFAAQESETMEALRGLVDEAYPDYEIVDSTRMGYILKHKKYSSLRLDVRFFQDEAVWERLPRERVNDDWFTHETFFRHAEGLPKDPRNQMNYDIDGFVKAYAGVRPGPSSVVSSVWLEKDWQGIETYCVLAARRNRTANGREPMWPDHVAYFHRDADSGTWFAGKFRSAELDSSWTWVYPAALQDKVDAIYAEEWEGEPWSAEVYGDPDEAGLIAQIFLEHLFIERDFAEGYEDIDPAFWEGGTAAEFEAQVLASPGYGEVTELELEGFKGNGINPSLTPGDFEIFLKGTAGDRTIYYRVKMRRDAKGAYRPALLTVQEKPFPPVANMAHF